MTCHPIRMGNGVTGFICTRGGGKKCTSCGGYRAELECDYPVSKPIGPLKVGQARAHLTKRVIFYVHEIESGKNPRVRVGRRAPSFAVDRATFWVPVIEWFTKTSATCDRAICGGCVARVMTAPGSTLDFCPAHGRAYAEGLRKAQERAKVEGRQQAPQKGKAHG